MSRHLGLVMPDPEDEQPEKSLPTPENLAALQRGAAMRRLREDTSNYPRLDRWPNLAAMAGALAPDELWLVGGRQGNGKSLFCQNVLDTMVTQEIPTLYIGTEQSAEVLKIKQACLRVGVTPRLVLKPDLAQIGTAVHEEAVALVMDEIRRWSEPPIRDLAFFANTSYVTRPELTKWVTGGVRRYGIQCVILDHIDHMDHGDGVNQRAEIDKTIAHVDVLLKTHHIPGLVASQIKRTQGDVFQRSSPPAAEDFAESSKKERVAAVMLSVWRPLRTDVDHKALRKMQEDAKQGTTDEVKLYQPNTMGIRLAKDRLGDVPGKQCMLYVGRGGRLTEDPIGNAAMQHGITTTAKSLL